MKQIFELLWNSSPFPNDEPFVNRIQAQIGQEFIADIMKLSNRESKQKAAY